MDFPIEKDEPTGGLVPRRAHKRHFGLTVVEATLFSAKVSSASIKPFAAGPLDGILGHLLLASMGPHLLLFFQSAKKFYERNSCPSAFKI